MAIFIWSAHWKREKKRNKACVKKAVISKILRKWHLAKWLPPPRFTPTKKGTSNIHIFIHIYVSHGKNKNVMEEVR